MCAAGSLGAARLLEHAIGPLDELERPWQGAVSGGQHETRPRVDPLRAVMVVTTADPDHVGDAEAALPQSCQRLVARDPIGVDPAVADRALVLGVSGSGRSAVPAVRRHGETLCGQGTLD